MHFVAHVLLIVGLCLAADNKSSAETEEVLTRKAKQEELVEVYQTRIKHAKVIANQIDDLLWKINEEKGREETELLGNSRMMFTDLEKVTNEYYDQLCSVFEKLKHTAKVSYEMLHVLALKMDAYVSQVKKVQEVLCTVLSCDENLIKRVNKSIEALKEMPDLQGAFMDQNIEEELDMKTVKFFIAELDGVRTRIKECTMIELSTLLNSMPKDESKEGVSIEGGAEMPEMSGTEKENTHLSLSNPLHD